MVRTEDTPEGRLVAVSVGVHMSNGSFVSLINSGTILPARFQRVFNTSLENQSKARFPLAASENNGAISTLGLLEIGNIAAADDGGSRIQLTIQIDARGRVHGSAKNLITGESARYLEDHPLDSESATNAGIPSPTREIRRERQRTMYRPETEEPVRPLESFKTSEPDRFAPVTINAWFAALMLAAVGALLVFMALTPVEVLEAQSSLTRGVSVLAIAAIGAPGLIVFGCWLYRVQKRLPLLGNPKVRFSPGWAPFSYLMPWVNLIAPWYVFREIAYGSHTGDRALGRPDKPLVLWWSLHWLSLLAQLPAGTLQQAGNPDVAALFAACAIGSGGCGLLVLAYWVLRIDRNQKKRYASLRSGPGERHFSASDLPFSVPKLNAIEVDTLASRHTKLLVLLIAWFALACVAALAALLLAGSDFAPRATLILGVLALASVTGLAPAILSLLVSLRSYPKGLGVVLGLFGLFPLLGAGLWIFAELRAKLTLIGNGCDVGLFGRRKR